MKELLEIGFFSAFYNFSNWPLSLAVYLCMLVGMAIQAIILRKAKKRLEKWIYPTFLIICAVFCEILTHIIIGWELLGVCLVYGLVITHILGMLLATVLHHIKHK